MQPTNSPASPTPVSDGKNVYVFFGDYGLICYGVDGDERWKMPLGPFNNANGHGSSPVLFDDLLVLICDQDTDSYLLALDKTAAKCAGSVERPEVTRGYATPAVYRPKKGPAELIVPGAYELIAYNLATGEKLWWVRGMAWQLKCGAVDRRRHRLHQRLGNRRRRRETARDPDLRRDPRRVRCEQGWQDLAGRSAGEIEELVPRAGLQSRRTDGRSRVEFLSRHEDRAEQHPRRASRGSRRRYR